MLFSWIGKADLASMNSGLGESKLDANFTAHSFTDGKGPVKTLLSNFESHDVHLLCNYDKSKGEAFSEWLGQSVTLHFVDFADPTDYSEIFPAVKSVLDKTGASSHPDVVFHLSSGTPAMAAIWVLLGKSLYPAQLVQTFNNEIKLAEIPFDIQLDLIPKLLASSDRIWTHLAEKSPQEIEGFQSIVGNSKAIREAVGRAQRIAIRDVATLITGESGTGKELFAKAIHAASHRRTNKIVAVNCAAFTADLLDSELFGHEKGAFTGASGAKKGAFEQADGGTLFLDEVGECSLEMQAKLLRVLQPPPGQSGSKRVFRKVGAEKDTVVDVRVISATNRDLEEEVQKGKFRDDLLYRLRIVALNLPPLRYRDGDVSLLAKALLLSINNQFQEVEPGYAPRQFSSDALEYIDRQPWIGNVRALSNCITQAAIMSDSTTLGLEDISAAMPGNQKVTQESKTLGEDFSINEHLDGIKRDYLRTAIRQSGGSKKRAAELLGYNNYQTLDNQLSSLGMKFREIWKE